jgi:hypothetical protein
MEFTRKNNTGAIKTGCTTENVNFVWYLTVEVIIPCRITLTSSHSIVLWQRYIDTEKEERSVHNVS